VPERPTGTVSVLFTDIEGATRLLQQLRERCEAVQSRHIHGGGGKRRARDPDSDAVSPDTSVNPYVRR
jgi:hypothetical protein